MRLLSWRGTAVLLACTLLAGAAAASGGSRGGGGSYRQSDPTYDRGKALFQGRAAEHRGLEVCFAASEPEGAPIPVTGRSAGTHRRGNVGEFAARLVRCDAPEAPLARELTRSDLRALLHYLNQRYSLRLK